jgi:HlyD family secretion protein
MKKRLAWILVLFVMVCGAIGGWRYLEGKRKPEAEFKTAAAETRRITGRVTASGALSALVTVQVGTQVSGRISKLFADFNSQVKKGQLVAKIDPQLFQASVDQAQANYIAAKAAIVKAQADAVNADKQFARQKSLREANLAAQADVDSSEAAAADAHANVDSAKASLLQAGAQMALAKVNLDYTNIISPIDGMVISRNVDVGQTVAASLSAPVLFTIAQDLTKMQVDTSVAEGDVGRLQVGMPTYFSVDAYPGQRFKGKIRDIRNAATTVQNVVTYDAVIDVDNSDLRLRPGMTANVTITYADRKDVLGVPNAALRFRPPPALMSSAAPSASHNHHHGPPDGAEAKTLWVMRGTRPQSVSVHTGLTDGTYTEILDGELQAGDQVVTETIGEEAPASTHGGGGGGGGGGAGGMPRMRL